MAAKLVIGLVVLAALIAIVMGVVFLYFKRKAELSHEEKMFDKKTRAELDESLVEMAEEETSIDAELEREEQQ
jgi:CHASE3 domain sensor protein